MSGTPKGEPTLGRRTLIGIKGAYLAGFFALLSGIFYPFVSQGPLGEVILGVLVLFLGLLGGIVVYRAVTSESVVPLLVLGFSMVASSFGLILYMSGALPA
ncbi:MAG: hypothetical protein OXU86_04295 [Thaumarchaeota archaeon]|nr:hypothetical protein [Nitrososphaerota archaeon]RNJ71913.1 MAG: hypothetical protein EB832_04965 [Thaumarchaeota archaeon S14]RNJ73835.1 MAG: hypothetical protein EB833_01980 [Thaumarchaeota archaeon S13]RNJ74023.1 MAG: hypothetical protein EB824_04155 [Thaumarchaeota archaeon S15]MDD9813869.1 hypothetical protein [Nitrososphaerota archaeon]